MVHHSKIDGLPLYISDPIQPRVFLTFSTDITGKWVAGYATPEGAWHAEPLVKDASSLEEAIYSLKTLTAPSTNKSKETND